jgi:hypothetical protein
VRVTGCEARAGGCTDAGGSVHAGRGECLTGHAVQTGHLISPVDHVVLARLVQIQLEAQQQVVHGAGGGLVLHPRAERALRDTHIRQRHRGTSAGAQAGSGAREHMLCGGMVVTAAGAGVLGARTACSSSAISMGAQRQPASRTAACAVAHGWRGRVGPDVLALSLGRWPELHDDHHARAAWQLHWAAGQAHRPAYLPRRYDVGVVAVVEHVGPVLQHAAQAAARAAAVHEQRLAPVGELRAVRRPCVSQQPALHGYSALDGCSQP